jgi:hypothetical protein
MGQELLRDEGQAQEITEETLPSGEILATEDEVKLATEAEQDENITNFPIIKHNAYSIVNIEFTLDELSRRRTPGNPWSGQAELEEIYRQLPEPLVEEHFHFYFDFLALSKIIQTRGPRVKCLKPGLRHEGRAITGKSLLLTLFPTAHKEWETDLLCTYLAKHATYFTAGREICPLTSREHVHVFVQFADIEHLRWLKVIFPSINIVHKLRNQLAARDYAIKDGVLLWDHGQFVPPIDRAEPAHLTGGRANKERWQRIMELAQNNDIPTIIAEFPGEFFRFNVTIEKIAAQAHMRQLQSQPPIIIELLKKNFYIWGQAGTGKTYLARQMAGQLPYSKAQNKWWDGYTEAHTGIVFNDISPMMGFNWQTILDAGDIYPFTAEVKNGSLTICPAGIPVLITSNYSPDEIMAGMNEARLNALKRRFSVVKVEWVYMGKAKILKWTYDPKSGFVPQRDVWWHQVDSDTDKEMEFERSIEAEEDEHEERAEQEAASEDENPFRGEAIDLRTALEQELIESRQLDQVEIHEEDQEVHGFSQRSRELLQHIQELEDRLRLMHPSIVASRVASTDSSETSEDSHASVEETPAAEED